MRLDESAPGAEDAGGVALVIDVEDDGLLLVVVGVSSPCSIALSDSVMALSTNVISPAAWRSSKYMTTLAKAASTIGRSGPSRHSSGHVALSRRKTSSIKASSASGGLTPNSRMGAREGGASPMPNCPHGMPGQPPSVAEPGMPPAREASTYSKNALVFSSGRAPSC